MAQPVSQYDEYEERDGELRAGRRAARRGAGARQSPADGDRADARGHGVVRRRIVVRLRAGDAACRRLRRRAADAVPLLRADERPTKVKPEQPGGMPMPDQNSSLYNDKLAKSPVEKLLPPPEQPLPRPAPRRSSRPLLRRSDASAEAARRRPAPPPAPPAVPQPPRRNAAAPKPSRAADRSVQKRGPPGDETRRGRSRSGSARCAAPRRRARNGSG